MIRHLIRWIGRLAAPLVMLLAMTLALLLNGCAVVSPVPAWELVKAAGAGTHTLLAMQSPGGAIRTVHHGDAPVRQLCIEYNRQAPLDDLVPAMQAELRALQVESRVYEPGSGLQQCVVWLRYVATLEWAVPPWATGYRANLSMATVSLHRADGTLMASSGWQADDAFGIGRWASTRHKIAPVMKALITGFER